MTSSSAVSQSELESLERRIRQALDARSVAALPVLGMGEASVALAWPDEEPTHAVKRLYVSNDPEDAERQFARVRDYMSRLQPHIKMPETEFRTVAAPSGRTIPFMIQPLYEKSQLVEEILAVEDPRPDHPVLLALVDAILATGADERQALDSQVSNFAWVDGELHFFDIGSPFLYDEEGNSEEFPGVIFSFPAVLRPILKIAIQKQMNNMGGLRYTFRQAAISLPRIGQERWLEPALTVFNTRLDEPLSSDEIHERISRMHGELKVMKRLMRAQRWWATKVRRQPYDTFITDSFTGALL